MNTFIYSFQSEWIKKKGSAAAWLTLIGGCFVPAIILFIRMYEWEGLSVANQNPHIWEMLYNRNWEFMGIFLLPLGVILVTSLVTQLEFRNNTWKQLYTTPQSLTTIFLAKLAVILILLAEFFLIFNIGIVLTGVLPALFFKGVPLPAEPFPLTSYMKGNAKFFLDCLPIVALQYLVSLRYRNFLVPLGIGLGLYVASMIAVHWKYGYLFPYTYCAYNFMPRAGELKNKDSIHLLALGYTIALLGVSYILYISKKEKG